jgi:hypothetical protein
MFSKIISLESISEKWSQYKDMSFAEIIGKRRAAGGGIA